jgi:DNA-binding SARP family transcriptional activator
MLSLRVLGPAGLTRVDGPPPDGVLRQPKRFGLFCYLALRKTPGEFVRRDRLIDVFWPDLDPVRARASLRQALSYLSGRLGKEAFVRRGPEELAMAPDRMTCDAWEFESRLCSGHLSEALDTYQGPLLDGFFLSGLPDFDHWLEARRRHLHDRAGSTAWDLCAQAVTRGELDRAAFWGKRAIELAGFDEARAGWLMKVLAYHGDRVGALRVYRGLEEYLGAEFDLAPSRDVRELADRIRSGAAMEAWAGGKPPALPGGLGLGRRAGAVRRALLDRRIRDIGGPGGSERRSGSDRRNLADRRSGSDRRRPVG